ncbi:hypothetical protein DPEC_G00271950 [Dallia pectoralis]|uniref:Uncharacterized protein n=1 Tax=Dallia pectoralis TaxID=75939 RepID=A0ACC2FQ04_DALPE|nr:hypothetical protein DPEC_G00271950 [Dallia pectoralis]
MYQGGRRSGRHLNNQEHLALHPNPPRRQFIRQGRGITGGSSNRARRSRGTCANYQGGTQEILTFKRRMSNLIVTSLQPLSILEDTGFKAFVNSMKFNINPNETYSIQQELFRMYTETKQKVKQFLAEADDIVLTSEMWELRPEESYITVTSHVIDQQWKLRSYVLETTNVMGGLDHKADMAKQLLRIANNWEIKPKIHAVVTNTVEAKKEVSQTGWTYIPCFAHTLDLVFEDVVKQDPSLKEVLSKCQKLVRFFHIDIEARQKIEFAQNEKMPHLSPIQSVGDGWISSYNMLKRLGDQYKAINKISGGCVRELNSQPCHCEHRGPVTEPKANRTAFETLQCLA